MFIDSHCHLNDPGLLPRLDEVIKGAFAVGVTSLLCIGWDLESSKKAVEIAKAHPGVYAAVGFQPENIDGHDLSELSEIKKLAQEKEVVAIGEIGLDYHWKYDPATKKRQKEWFIAQIALANELGLPVSIHGRDASGDILSLLKAHPLKANGVLHCYSGSVEILKELAKLGFYFGFDGPITYRNANTPKECVKACPLDRLLSETDSPYLPPVPFRGQSNEPKYIPYIVKQMAVLKGLDEAVVVQKIKENFERLFSVKQ